SAEDSPGVDPRLVGGVAPALGGVLDEQGEAFAAVEGHRGVEVVTSAYRVAVILRGPGEHLEPRDVLRPAANAVHFAAGLLDGAAVEAVDAHPERGELLTAAAVARGLRPACRRLGEPAGGVGVTGPVRALVRVPNPAHALRGGSYQVNGPPEVDACWAGPRHRIGVAAHECHAYRQGEHGEENERPSKHTETP